MRTTATAGNQGGESAKVARERQAFPVDQENFALDKQEALKVTYSTRNALIQKCTDAFEGLVTTSKFNFICAPGYSCVHGNEKANKLAKQEAEGICFKA